MRKLTGAVQQTLDGVIQSLGAPDEDRAGGFRFGGWSVPFMDDSMAEPNNRLFLEPDYDLLLGRRTYDMFASFWPYNQDNPVGAKFQRINKYVVTHSDEPLEWQNSHKLSGDTARVIRELKQSEGRDLLIQGSGTIYPALINAGLIDRLILITFPVVLGEGKRIFEAWPNTAMRLADHHVAASGVIFATYEPDGPARTGTFATKEPSAAELERRMQIEREEADRA